MESITAFVACGAAFALSYYFGYDRAPSTFIALILGAVSGIGFAVVFFAVTVAVAIMLPGTFDARTLGVNFARLLVLAPLGAAAIGALAHRHAMARMRF
ncbi:MAG: hypothetical protein Q8M19_14775 [Reyranella sp.]|nr:hypothetical protein [Reyranella sp.]